MIEPIPDKHFKMIRYFGFLSNRRRSEMLPKVYDALGIAPKDSPEMPGYAAMLKGYVKVDPFECILCGHRLTFLRITVVDINSFQLALIFCNKPLLKKTTLKRVVMESR